MDRGDLESGIPIPHKQSHAQLLNLFQSPASSSPVITVIYKQKGGIPLLVQLNGVNE